MISCKLSGSIVACPWAPAGGGGAGKSRPSPPPGKTGSFWLYLEPFCSFFFIWGPFCYVLLIMGGLFHHVGAFLLLFTPWWVPFLCLPPPLPPYENFCEHLCACPICRDARYTLFWDFLDDGDPLGCLHISMQNIYSSSIIYNNRTKPI